MQINVCDRCRKEISGGIKPIRLLVGMNKPEFCKKCKKEYDKFMDIK